MINASVSGAASNSYVTAAEALAYFALRLNGADWLAIGTAQVETATVAGTIGASGVGDAQVIVTAAGMTNSPKTLSVAVANNDTASQVAGKIRTALAADVDVSAFFTVSGANANVILTALIPTFNDSTMNLSIDNGTCTGLTPALTSAHTTAGTGEREIALITATSELDKLNYYGSKTDADQALKFPRSGVRDGDGVLFDEDQIPTPVKRAQFELALYLAQNPETLESGGDLSEFKSLTLGNTGVVIQPSGTDSTPRLPSRILLLLNSFRVSQARVIRA